VRLPSLHKDARKLQRLMLGYATELEMDNQGRILLPREHRDFAGLEQKAMLIGQGNKLELWELERWNTRRDEWLAGDDSDFKDLPAELETLSL
jgi:MraZ protein